MALVHDLAEAQGESFSLYHWLTLTSPPFIPVGDIAPREGIPKEEKQRLETVRHSLVNP